MADEILKRDGNYVTVLGAITDNAAQEIMMLRVDPITKRLLVSATGGGAGTVTSVSVASANGFSGTVATATTTPAITIIAGAITPTSVNGLIITTTTGTFSLTNGKTLTVLKTISLTSADDTGTYTLPTGTKTLVATDVATLSSLVSIGTITTGIWTGTTIAVANGGTGLTTIAALSIPLANSSNVFTSVTPGAGNSIRINAGGTAWEAYTPASGAGDMVLADVQTVTGAKTFGTIGGAVGKLILAGSTSGSSILNATAIAGTTTITIPAATDTLVGKATTDTLTNKTIDADGTGNSITNIENADIKAAAAIAVNKLAALTASEIVISDASGFIASGAVATYPSLTELIYVKGLTSSAQTQITARLPLAGGTMTGDLLGAVSHGATGTRITKLWATDIESTNMPTVGGTAILTSLTAPQFTTIELGHASDTTLARSSAGKVTVEGASVYLEGYTTTATAAGTTTLTVANNAQQYFTGSTTQTVVLPVTSTLVLGQNFTIKNLSTGIVTVQSSGANTILAVPSVTTAIFTCILITGTTDASWSVSSYLNTPSAGGSTTPVLTLTANYDATGRYTNSLTGSGGIAFGTDSVRLLTGATGASKSSVQWNLTNLNTFNIYTGSPTISMTVDLDTIGTNCGYFTGIAGQNIRDLDGGNLLDLVARHIGFKIIRVASGAINLHATQADGTTETASASLTTVATTDALDFIIKVNTTVSVDYYWRKSGSALSSATNLTTNIPTNAANTNVCVISVVSNQNVATSSAFRISGSSYSR